MSSIYTTQNLPIKPNKTLFKVLWKTQRAFLRPKGMHINSKFPMSAKTGLEIREKSGNLFTGYSETESCNLRL